MWPENEKNCWYGNQIQSSVYPSNYGGDELRWNDPPQYQNGYPMQTFTDQPAQNCLAPPLTGSCREKTIVDVDCFEPTTVTEDKGTKYETKGSQSFPPKIEDNLENCETYVIYRKDAALRLEQENQPHHITRQALKESNLRYEILGSFYIQSAVRYGGVIQVKGEYKKNEQERVPFIVLLSYENYLDGNNISAFRTAGVLCFNADITEKKLNRYLQELIRLKLREEQAPPAMCGFDQWKGRHVFASAEFCEREQLPAIIDKHFDSDTSQTFEDCGNLFLETARNSSNLKLFLTLNLIRLMGLMMTVLSRAGIRTPKAIFVKGDAEKIAKFFQVYDRGFSLQRPFRINVPSKEFEAYLKDIRDIVLMLWADEADSKYRKDLGEQNVRRIEEMLTDNQNNRNLDYPYLFVIFSERLGQEMNSENAFLLDVSDFTMQGSSDAVIKSMYDFDRKIVNRICAEMSDCQNQLSTLYHQWYGKVSLGSVQSESGRKFLAILLTLMNLVTEWFAASFETIISMSDMEEYLTDLVQRSESTSSGGDCSKEFSIVCNRMIMNDELGLFLHSPLSKGVSSSTSIPPVFMDDSYLYFTEEAFTAVSSRMQLPLNSCAVRKSLYEAGKLKPADELQVQVTLYDRHYNGRQYVTAVKRSILTEDSLCKLQGGIFDFAPCEDDGTRIPVGTDERGRMVYLSPNHPDLGNKHILIIGDSGTGKSTAGNLIVASKYKQGENIIFVDFSNSNSEVKMLSHGFDRSFYDAHVRRIELESIKNKDDLLLILWEMQESHIIPVFYTTKYGDQTETFLELLYDQIVADETLSATLVIDEIHELNYGKGSALCHIMEKGRGNGISLISILQAPHELKPKQLSILNQASVKLIFGLNDGDDARACAEKIGVKPYYRFMEVFGEMPKRNCLVVGALEDSDGELRPKRFSKVQITNLSKKI